MEVEKIDHCVKLSNLARFGDVRQAVADKIGVGALSLSLVYRLDITAAAQKGNYREFGSQEDWDDLLEEARIHRNAQLKKKTGGSPDGWSIRMKMKLPTTGSNAATKKVSGLLLMISLLISPLGSHPDRTHTTRC
jgi:hypothetical protein